jgi:ribulose bisphosphate carboxylase small subunit
MLTTDIKKWAETTREEVETIATTTWAIEFNYEQLRSFQASYTHAIEALSTRNDGEALVLVSAFQKMLDVATRAIDFQQFGD